MGLRGIKAGFDSLASAFTAVTAPAAELENASAKLAVVLGDAAAADRLTSSLQHLATNGVVGMKDLTDGARTLSAVMSDDRAISHYVGVFADISAASGLTVQQLAGMVAKTEDAASASARLNTLTAAGVPITEALAAAMGKSTQEIAELQKEGKITGSDLLAAFEKLTESGGKFANMNATMSNTTQGSWETLTASITECMAELGKPINDAMRPLLQDLSTWVQQHGGDFKELGASIGTALKGICTAVGTLGPIVLNAATSVHTLTFAFAVLAQRMHKQVAVACVSLVSGAFKSLRTALITLGTGVVTCEGVWSFAWWGIVQATKAACRAIKAAIASTGVGLLVWGIGEAAAWAYEKLGGMGDEAQEVGQFAAESAEEAAEASRRAVEQSQQELKVREEIAEQQRQQAAAAEEQRKKEEANLKTLAEMRKAAADERFEKAVDAERHGLYGAEGAVKLRLERVNAPSVDALQQELDKLLNESHPTDEQVARAKELTAALRAIEKEYDDVAKTAADAAKKQRDEQKRVWEQEEEYIRRRKQHTLEGKSLNEQKEGLTEAARALGVSGKMSSNSITDRIANLNEQGGHEKEIAQLQDLRTRWDALIERKKAYNRERAAGNDNLRADFMELSGDKVGADKLREEIAVRERINQLTKEGMVEEQARQQAMAESKLRQLQAIRQQNLGVLEIKQSRVSVGGGGTNIRVDYQREAMRKSNDLLTDIRRLLENGLKIDLSGKINATPTLA